jgi:hypothetical protein
MTYAFQEDYRRRRLQVKRYFALVAQTERETKLSDTRKLTADRLHILRAGAFLIAYNLIEASARAALEAIHDEMAAKRVPFGGLNHGIRREVIKGFKRNADPDTHSLIKNIPIEIVAASLDVEYHFSGNVDAKLLREVAETYGFSADTDAVKTHGGKDLLTIKAYRNDLAHGNKTYDDVGREFTARNLLELGLRALAYMEDILKNVADYLDAEAYREKT